MKKLFYILSIIGSLFVFACNDNSEEVYEELEPAKVEVQNNNLHINADFDRR